MARPLRKCFEMTRLILHIGQHKTGTTSLQHQLAKHRPYLRSVGAIFPELPRWKYAHHALFPHFFGLERCDPYVFRRLGDSPSRVIAASRAAWERVKKMVIKEDPLSVILSSETFFRAGIEEEMGRFASILREVFDEIEVVCYIRNPAELLVSLLSTQVQVRSQFEWPPPGLRKDVLTSYERIRANKYHIRKYDRDTLLKGDITYDFWRHLIDGDIPKLTSQSMNRSLSAEAMIVMKKYVEFSKKSPDGRIPLRQQVFRRLLHQLDYRVKGFRPARPRPAAEAEVMDACTDLEWLWNKHGIRWRKKPAADTQTRAGRLTYGKEVSIVELCDVEMERLGRLERTVSLLGMDRALRIA